MQGILIYSTKNCPNCRVLKQFLENKNVRFTEVDMATPAALTELRMNGVFTMAAPVLQIGNKFHTYNDLFTQDRINQNKLESLLNEGK
ncbi:MAG: glutaredoxin family protein [Candidatus Methanoperedens sp.]|nr:glutaredoxin family protein [Candidatus Methanoperedens sp.]